jgi:ATP-grasp domain
MKFIPQHATPEPAGVVFSDDEDRTDVDPIPLPASERPGTALLTSSSWWAFPARIAMRFAALGWRVEAVCPPGHPLRAARAVARLHPYAALRPAASLAAAITAAEPDLIVPCDDRAVTHLHDLHRRPEMRPVIARSLGRAESFQVVDRRADLIRIAREEGVLAPETRLVENVAALRAVLDDFGLPVVLKVDGSWGGLGTQVVHTAAEAERALGMLARPIGAARALRNLLVDRDPFNLLPYFARMPQRVNVQRFVRGRPANSLVACWEGEVLAGIQVEVLSGHEGLGSSTVVRVIKHPDMTRAAQTLARRLGLSGFYGFDFMIEDATGRAQMIEMNPRSTQLCHLGLGAGRDPIAALLARLQGAAGPPPALLPVTDKSVIAFFPNAWLLKPDSAFLSTGYHDVPWSDPDLMRELVRQPYYDRGLLARLVARLRRAPWRFSQPRAGGQNYFRTLASGDRDAS